MDNKVFIRNVDDERFDIGHTKVFSRHRTNLLSKTGHLNREVALKKLPTVQWLPHCILPQRNGVTKSMGAVKLTGTERVPALC